MPCTLCYADGHNRRTCQRWDLLAAVRREESARLDMIHHNHLHIIAAANVAIATSEAAIAATSATARDRVAQQRQQAQQQARQQSKPSKETR